MHTLSSALNHQEGKLGLIVPVEPLSDSNPVTSNLA